MRIVGNVEYSVEKKEFTVAATCITEKKGVQFIPVNWVIHQDDFIICIFFAFPLLKLVLQNKKQ